jgi:hypothetical protein
VLARIEAESAQKETSSGREMAASQAEEDVAAAARAWPRHPLARCWRPPLGGGPFRLGRRPRPGQVPSRVETTPRVLLLPCRCLNLRKQFVCSTRMFFHGR